MWRRLLSTGPEPTFLADVTFTILRVFPALAMALSHGLRKLPPSERFVANIDGWGFPAPELFAWAAALAEVVGGILLAAGLFTRLWALLIAITMIVAAFVAHGPDPFSDKESALLYLVVMLFFVARGGGRWSLDRWLSRSRSRSR